MQIFGRVLLVWLWMSLGLDADPVSLRSQQGRSYRGVIKRVQRLQVYFETVDGEMCKMPISVLDLAGRNTVNSWIRKRGGNTEFTSWIGTSGVSFGQPWPSMVYAPSGIHLRKVQPLSKGKPLIYESMHYRFVMDCDVEARVVQRFAVLFEATYNYLLSLPLNASARYLESGEKFSIFLFGEYAAYQRAGGPSGSAGVYLPRSGSVLVPLTVLGVRWNGRKWEYEKEASNAVLSHELAHQLTAGVEFSAWYIEGTAEYVAATRYTHGAYHVGGGKSRVFDYVCSKNGLKEGIGRRLGTRIKMASLEHFMKQPYQSFVRGDVNQNYGVALLLTYFFYHVDGAGDGSKIKSYIKAVQQGSDPVSAQKLLLRNRSYAQLQEEFRRFCAQGGLAIDFQ